MDLTHHFLVNNQIIFSVKKTALAKGKPFVGAQP